MIILPDKNILRSKFLMPVPKKEWMPSSQAMAKDQYGNDGTKTQFRVRARLNDGFVKWSGIFDDRDDFDNFLFALFKKTLKYEKHLWGLCCPNWSPDIGEQLSYDFATFVTLSSPTGSQQTYLRPTDWQDPGFVYTIGGGGGGRRQATSGVAGAGGAGGGAFALNTVTIAGTSAIYLIGAFGAGATTAATSGGTGGNTWFNTVSAAQPTTTAQGVLAIGGSGSTGSTGAAAGTAAASIGASKNNGGTGGNGQGTNGAGGGGGGAGGGSGAGGNGTNGASGAGGNGGAGNGGLAGGGAGATPDGGTGGNGTNFNGSIGSGGGGGGGGSASTAGGIGGNYGAGGGGGRTTSTGSAAGGRGSQGIIWLFYEPYVGGWNNSPMLGM